MPEPIVVQFTEQRGGLNFVLHPSSHAVVRDLEEVEPIADTVFLGSPPKTPADEIALESVQRHVVPLLTGLSVANVLERFGAVEFEEMPSEEVVHVIEGEPDE